MYYPWNFPVPHTQWSSKIPNNHLLSLPTSRILGSRAFLPHRRLTLLQFDEFVFLGFPNSGSGEKGLKLKVTKAVISKLHCFTWCCNMPNNGYWFGDSCRSISTSTICGPKWYIRVCVCLLYISYYYCHCTQCIAAHSCATPCWNNQKPMIPHHPMAVHHWQARLYCRLSVKPRKKKHESLLLKLRTLHIIKHD